MVSAGPDTSRTLLERCFAAGVAAVNPELATGQALQAAPIPDQDPAIIATGKGAHGMARAAVEWLAGLGREPAGGIVVSHEHTAPPHPMMLALRGDHPTPGAGSLAAAEALAHTIDRLDPTTPVHVFISGGTSALIGAPLDGIAPDELRLAFDLFHELGLDIGAMNALRGRLTRWSNGRLGVALAPRSVHAWLISDVIGSALHTIGSGPLVPNTVPVQTMFDLLGGAEVVARLPASVAHAVRIPDTAPSRSIPHVVVADGPMAVDAAVTAARAAGCEAVAHRTPITGEAEAAGRTLARWIRDEMARTRLPDSDTVVVRPAPRIGVVHAWHSETTVTLPQQHGKGGRAQHMALALAREFIASGWPEGVTVLVAGTDGRDGPTDAAGAVVSAQTAGRLMAADVDLDAVLTRCDAYAALDASGALMRTGSTGTNVADLVIVRMWNWY